VSRHRIALILIATAALLLPLTFFWHGRQELQTARLELAGLNKANDVLKRTLADMIVAISAKDKEIDRLRLSACDGSGKVAAARVRPAHDSTAAGRPFTAEGSTR
jgi:hypothetical protein